MVEATEENIVSLFRGLGADERRVLFASALGLASPPLQSLANPHNARSRVIYQMATMPHSDLARLAAMVDSIAGIPPEMRGKP